MGEYESVWTRYWLRSNPFFTEPLEIDGSPIPVESLVGRNEEKRAISSLIRMGGGTRFIVFGEPGVGKTSLVNLIRNEARKSNFISPIREISIPINPNPQRVMVETLVLLYEEIKNKGIKLPEKDRKKLEMLQPFADLEDFEGEGSEWVTSTTSILVSLFKSLTKELRATGYSAVILHYNNLDKIKDEEKILNLFQEIREFLQNPDSIMIFIGDDLAHNAISSEPRIKQIFQFPAIEVRPLSYEETREIIEKRIELLRIDKSRDVKVLEEGVIRILWNLFKGNIREILNSLSFTFRELPQGNLPVTITNLRLKDVLHEAVNKNYLNKLNAEEKAVLRIILDAGKITPSELAIKSGKRPQNISSYYLKRLIEAKAVELIEARGRQRFYAVVPQVHWWKLEKTTEEQEQEKKLTEQTKNRLKDIQKKLIE